MAGKPTAGAPWQSMADQPLHGNWKHTQVATHADLLAQVGSTQQPFEPVSHDRLPPEHVFYVRKDLRFTDFKRMVRVGVAGVEGAAEHACSKLTN